MTKEAVQQAMTEARDCALLMMENAGFIQGELAKVVMPPALRKRTKQLCEEMIGTKHDVISELFQIDELAGKKASAPEVAERLDRIVRWIEDDVGRMHDLVLSLRSASEKDSRHTLAYVLVMESATNIRNSFSRVAAAVQAMHQGAAKDS